MAYIHAPHSNLIGFRKLNDHPATGPFYPYQGPVAHRDQAVTAFLFRNAERLVEIPNLEKMGDIRLDGTCYRVVDA